MRMQKSFVVALTAAAFLLSPTVDGFGFGADAAYAKSDKAGGKGGGKGGGSSSKGSSGSKGGSKGGSTGTSFSPKKADTAPAKTTGKPAKANHGAIASELKGLNAAHASPTAMANAAPGSRVGRVAAYATAVGATAALAAELEPLETELAGLLENPPRSIDDIQADMDALADPDGVDKDAYDALAAEKEAAEAYPGAVAALEGEIEGLKEDIAEAEGAEADALLAASDGRTLSPEALAELHELLGLPAPVEEPDPAPATVVADGTDAGDGTDGATE